MPGLTPSNGQTALVNLDLTAVALCAEGANSRAHILLTKGKEKSEMKFEDLLKSLQPEHAAIITAHIAEIETAKAKELEDLQKELKTATDEAETLKKSKPAATTEDVLKNASPEVKELITKLQTSVSTLVAAQEEQIAKDRFAKVKAIPADETLLMSVLKSASPATLQVLEKAAAAIETGLVGKGVAGQADATGTNSMDYYAILEKSARSIMATDAKLTFEKAFTQACSADSVTYEKYVKGEK